MICLMYDGHCLLQAAPSIDLHLLTSGRVVKEDKRAMGGTFPLSCFPGSVSNPCPLPRKKAALLVYYREDGLVNVIVDGSERYGESAGTMPTSPGGERRQQLRRKHEEGKRLRLRAIFPCQPLQCIIGPTGRLPYAPNS